MENSKEAQTSAANKQQVAEANGETQLRVWKRPEMSTFPLREALNGGIMSIDSGPYRFFSI